MHALIEMIQFAFIIIPLVILVVWVLDRLFVHRTHCSRYSHDKEISRLESKPILVLACILFLRISLICLLYYLLCKGIYYIPSIGHWLNEAHESHSAIKYVLDVAFIAVVIGMSDFALGPIEALKNRLVQ